MFILHSFGIVAVTLILSPVTKSPQVSLLLDAKRVCVNDPILGKISVFNSTIQPLILRNFLGGNCETVYFEIRRADDMTIRIRYPSRYGEGCSVQQRTSILPMDSLSVHELLFDSPTAVLTGYPGSISIRAVVVPFAGVEIRSSWVDIDIVRRSAESTKYVSLHYDFLSRLIGASGTSDATRFEKLRKITRQLDESNLRKHSEAAIALSIAYTAKGDLSPSFATVRDILDALPDPVSKERYRVAVALIYAEHGHTTTADKFKPFLLRTRETDIIDAFAMPEKGK